MLRGLGHVVTRAGRRKPKANYMQSATGTLLLSPSSLDRYWLGMDHAPQKGLLLLESLTEYQVAKLLQHLAEAEPALRSSLSPLLVPSKAAWMELWTVHTIIKASVRVLCTGAGTGVPAGKLCRLS